MTALSTLRDDLHVKIELDLEHRMLISRWKGYVPSEEYRAILLQIQGSIAEHQLHFWLSDSRKMGAILHEDTVWSREDLGPLLASTELKALAILNSSDIIHQMAAGRMVKESGPSAPYRMAFFDDQESAMNWLLAPDAKADE